MTYRRPAYAVLRERLLEPRRFLLVLAGPRQVGKTTLATQVLKSLRRPQHFASADEPTLQDRVWLEQQWETARDRARRAPRTGALLVLDEVQKITGWAETVKRLWDEDTRSRLRLRVLLLGSAPLLVQRGLTESLAGRFEIITLGHWSYPEMQAAFGWDLETFLFYGGYPGAAPLIADPNRWSRYIRDALIETTLSRDVLLLSRVDKPALLRRLFLLGCEYSGQILSYQKMLGQLQDAGNTTTLAHYLDLLGGAGMLTGLEKFGRAKVRQRGSSPKLQVLNTALWTATSGLRHKDFASDRERWGRLVESAVGAHLHDGVAAGIEVTYWRDRGREVDFVLSAGRALTAIEVKSGRTKHAPPGLEAFRKQFGAARLLLVGGSGIPLEEFLSRPVTDWVG